MPIINQNNADTGLTINKNDTGNNIAVSVSNSGTGDTLYLDQIGEGTPIHIVSAAATAPLIELEPTNGNTRGDIAFNLNRIVDPLSPQEGDLWYNATDNLMKFYDGTGAIDIGVGKTLQESYDNGQSIATDSGAFTVTNTSISSAVNIISSVTAGISLDINSSALVDGIRINHSGTAGNSVPLRITKSVGGAHALVVNQSGSGKSLEINQNNTAGVNTCIDINHTNGGGGSFIELSSVGGSTAPAIQITLDTSSPGINLTQSGANFNSDSLVINNSNNGAGITVNQSATNFGINILKSNTSTGNALGITNSGTGQGLGITQIGESSGLVVSKSATGTANVIEINNTGTGHDIRGNLIAGWFVDKDGKAKVVALRTGAAPNNVKILSGNVTTGGTISQPGTGGWTVAKAGTGRYTITFTEAFLAVPAVTVTTDRSGFDAGATYTSLAAGSVEVKTWNSNSGAVLEDRPFSFIAIGAR